MKEGANDQLILVDLSNNMLKVVIKIITTFSMYCIILYHYYVTLVVMILEIYTKKVLLLIHLFYNLF